MPQNPFTVIPGADMGPGLMGLAETLGKVGERKKAEKLAQVAQEKDTAMREEISSAMASHDADKIRAVAGKYPELGSKIKDIVEMKLPGDAADKYKNALFSATIDPSQSSVALEEMRTQMAADGLDAQEQAKLDNLKSLLKSDPEKAKKVMAGELAMIADEDMWKRYQDIIKPTEKNDYAPTNTKKLIDERQELIDSGVPTDDPRILAYDHQLAGNTIDPAMVDALSTQVIEGRLDPNAISKRGGLQQAVFTRVESMAPGANLTELSANAKFKSLPANLTSRALINGVAPLYESLLVAGRALNNSRFQLYNKAVNYYKEETGDPGIVAFNNLRDDVIAETERILLGSGVLSDSKYLRALRNVSSAQSYDQLKAAVDQLQLVVRKRLEALDMAPFKNANPNMPAKELYFDSQGNPL